MNDRKLLEKKIAKRENILDTAGQTQGFKKVVQWHQSNDYTKINRHMESLCFMCWKRDVCFARLIHICHDCIGKKGQEALLAHVKEDIYGWCVNCGKYKFRVHYVNMRACIKCSARIAKREQDWNLGGGMYQLDPYWKLLRRVYGKDFLLLSDPNIAVRLKR